MDRKKDLRNGISENAMKKKLLSAAMIVLMIIGIMPCNVLAATKQPDEYTDSISREECTVADSISSESKAASSDSYSVTFTSKKQDYTRSLTLKNSGHLKLAIKSDIDLELNIYKESKGTNEYEYIKINKGSSDVDIDLAAGKYALYYRPKWGTENGSFSCTPSFAASGETYTYENNKINLVRDRAAIPFNSTVKGQLAWNDDIDIYKIVLPEAGHLDLNFSSKIEEMRVRINYSTGDFDYFDGNQEMTRGSKTFTRDLAAGTYYLIVEKCYNKTGNYNFTASYKSANETYKYDNNTVNAIRNSTSIPMETQINGQLADNDDCDYFKLTIPSKGKYDISVTSEIELVKLEVYDAQENQNATADGSRYVSHYKGTGTYHYNLNKGTYYLKFEQGNTGNYNFRVEKIVSVSRPNITKASGKKKSAKIKWKSVDCEGYMVQCAKNRSFTEGLKEYETGSTSKTIKSLKAGKKYYVRVRAYSVYKGETYYSKWSKIKSIKIK